MVIVLKSYAVDKNCTLIIVALRPKTLNKEKNMTI